MYCLIATLADKGEEVIAGTIAAFRGFMDCLDNVEEAEHIIGYEAYHKR